MKYFIQESDFAALQLVRTSRLIRFLGRLTLVTLLVCILAMLFLPWQQTAPGTGVVLALDPQQRPQPVMSAVKGAVVSYVKPGLREGSYVEKDELLLKLKPFAAEGVSETETQIKAVQDKVSAYRSGRDVMVTAADLQEESNRRMNESLNQELQAARQKWEQAKNKLAAAKSELVDKRNQEKIAEEVYPAGLIPFQELVTKRQAAETQYQKYLEAENSVEENYRTLMAKEEEIEAKRQELDIKSRTARNKVFAEETKLQSALKELSDLQVKRSEQDRLEVRAPRSGVIQEWNGLEESSSIKEGQQLFLIVPEADELCVEMKINGRDLPLLHEGDMVRLQFEGWPAVQFVGWPSAAVGTFGGTVNRIYPTDDGMGNFRIVVTPQDHFKREEGWPENRYLRQGVRANGWVLIKEVPLGWEIWRQLNGFPPTVSKESASKDESKSKVPKVKLPKS